MKQKNRYLLWNLYIRSHFVYCCSLISTQNKTIQQQFKKLYQLSFKKFMRLPQNLSKEVLNFLLEDFDSLCNRFHKIIKTKTENRFNMENAQLNNQQEEDKDEVFIN